MRAYPVRPLPEILGHLVSAQETVFRLLERPQRPPHARQLYFLSAVLGGLLAKASHDLADPHAALAQSRTAWLCAEQADHNGLRAWICGLQALIAYWARRPHDSLRYAQRGSAHAQRAGSTTLVWLAASEACAWAVLGNTKETRVAVERAERSWDCVRHDDLDEMGGLATFSQPRQLHFAADAFIWLTNEAEAAEDYAQRAVTAYSDPNEPNWTFAGAAGSRANLALVRVRRWDTEGALEALKPVLDLTTAQRINGIVQSVNRVHQALSQISTNATVGDLQERIENYTSTPVRALTR